jgi:hypothetical protein
VGFGWVRVRTRVRAHLDERRLGYPAVAETACIEQQGGAEDSRRNPYDAVEEHLRGAPKKSGRTARTPKAGTRNEHVLCPETRG